VSQVSAVLRRGPGRYFHWCPGCESMHPLPDSWSFNGDVHKPTFTPSFLQTGSGVGKNRTCHYILTDGVLNFCGDSTHALAGQSVPMPPVPPEHATEWGLQDAVGGERP